MQYEKDLEQKLVQLCKNNNIWCLKFTAVGTAGLPDRVLISYDTGAIGFLELKRTGEKPRPLQKYMMKQLRKFKQLVDWTDNYEGCEDFVRRLLEK